MDSANNKTPEAVSPEPSVKGTTFVAEERRVFLEAKEDTYRKIKEASERLSEVNQKELVDIPTWNVTFSLTQRSSIEKSLAYVSHPKINPYIYTSEEQLDVYLRSILLCL